MNNKFLKYTNINKKTTVPENMKAVVMRGKGVENLEIVTIPVPQPGDNQVLCRIDAFSICPSIPKLLKKGSDHKFLNVWDIRKNPIIIGDEGAVTVIKPGKNLVDKYKIGEKYAIQPAVEHEPINNRERYNNPEQMKKVAVGYTLGGTFAEYILIQEEVLEADCFIKLPSPELGYYEISLSEPLSCVVSSQDHHVHLVVGPDTYQRIPKKGLLKGGVTVIFGAGVMAKFHIELAMSYNPGTIIIFNRSEKRFEWIEKHLRKRAEEKNIALYCEPLDLNNLQSKLLSLAKQNYADDIIDTTASPEVVEHALDQLTGKGTVFNSYGGLNIGQNIINTDMRKVHYDESILTGSSGGNPSDTIKTLELIKNREFNVGIQVKLIGGISHAITFLDMVKNSKIDGKAVVYPHTKLGHALIVEEEWTREKEKEHLSKFLE